MSSLSDMVSARSLKSRLLSIEKDFISAVVSGEDAILAFNNRWERLVEDVDAALESAGLDDETASLVHATASRMATLADISADIYTSYNDFTNELVEQVDSMMSELKLVDVPSPSVSPSSPELPNLASSCNVCSKRRRAPSPSPRPTQLRTTATVLSPETICFSLPSSGASFSPAYAARDTSLDSSWHACVSSTPLCTSTSTAMPRCRKRRLSDADASGPPIARKRPHPGPRIHAVSDSFVAYHTASKRPETNTPSPTVSMCSLATSDIAVPLEVQSVGENGVSSFFLGADNTPFIQISNIDTNWLDSIVAPVPPQDFDGLDIVLDSLLDPIHASNGLTDLDSSVSRSPSPLPQPWPAALLAPATPPLDADVDHPDSPSIVTFSLSRPVTPALGGAGALNDCATILPADSTPLCGNPGDVLTSNLLWDSPFRHPEANSWLSTSSPYSMPVAGDFGGKGTVDGSLRDTAGLRKDVALPLFMQTGVFPASAEVEAVVTKGPSEWVPQPGFVM